MTKGLQEVVLPGLTSKGSRYHKAYYTYPSAVSSGQVRTIKAGQLLVEINSFANPYPYQKCQLQSFLTDSPFIKDFQQLWQYIKHIYLKELPDLAYKDIPTENEIEESIVTIIQHLFIKD